MGEDTRLQPHLKTSPGVRMPPFELMERIPIFSALTPRTRGFLLAGAQRIHLDTNGTFFVQGEPGDGVFILESGSVEVIKRHEQGLIRLRTLRKGDCFGEIALLAMLPRTATVRAREPSSAIWIKSNCFQKLCAEDLEQFTILMMNLSREVCRRLQSTDEMLFRINPGALVAARDAAEAAQTKSAE